MKYVNYDNLETAKEMIKAALDKKVDKESGKGLSTNDYTNEEKNKLAGIEEEANKTIVDSELNLESTNPVENKVVSEELNTKANKVEVEEALDTKADKVDVEEALNTKADKIAVEEALETKADKQEVTEALDTKVDKESGKGLSTNDFTNEEKEKLSKLNINSNENVIEVIKQNGEVLEIQDKSVNIVTITEDTIDNKIENAVKNVEVDLTDYAKRSDIPKNVSDLFNDKAFIASSDEKDPTVPAHVKAITEEDIEKWNSGTGTGSGNETCNVVVDAVEPSNGEAIWIKLAKNLCHFNNVKNEYSINSAGKVISDYMWNKWLTTDFIEVEPDTVYTLSGIQYGTNGRYHAWYDSNKNPISAFLRYVPAGQNDSQTVTSPSNAKYIRFTIYNGYDDARLDERLSFQFEKGSVATSYAPYSGKSDMFVKNSNGEYEQIYEAFPVPLPENEQYTLPVATADTLGGIKVGNNLTVDADGTLHAQAGGGVSEETDPTVPAHVKAITEEDIEKWNSGTGGSVDVSGMDIQNNILTATLPNTVTISETNVTQSVTSFVETSKIGDKFSVENGVIKVGAGVTKVKISYSACMQATNSTTGGFTYLIKNGMPISQEVYTFDKTSQVVTNVVPPVVVDVSEGDTITLLLYGYAGNSLLGIADRFVYKTNITIEEVNEVSVIGTERNNGTYMWIHNSAAINLEANAYYKLGFDKLIADTSNGKLIHEDGGIRIGKGVKQILVISKWNTWTTTCNKYINLVKNGTSIESASFNKGVWTANIVSYVDVTEGDYIEIQAYHDHTSSMSISSNDQQTGLKVIVLGETTNVEINGDVTGGSENINSTDFNTKWINAELTEHFKLYNDSSYCRYSKVGNMVNIQFVLSPAKSDNVLNSATETTAFTLPEEYRPSQNLNVLCQGSSTYVFNVGVNASGNVNIYRYRNSSSYNNSPPSTTAWLPCNITYFVDSGEMIVGSGSSTTENGVILYENEEGSGGPITLSKSLSEFKYVEIFYSYLGNTWGYDYTKIEDPDGKLTNLTMTVLNNDKIYTTTSTWSLNGTEVVRTKGERFRFGVEPQITRAENADDIVINKIIGHYSDSSSGGGTIDAVEKLSKVLYEDNTGSTTSVTLSETSANFKYMEIYCKSGDSTYTSVKVHEPNGKRVTATSGWFGSAAYFKNSVIDIIDDQVIFVAHNASEITGKNLSNTVGLTKESASAMSIVKVVGYYDEPSVIIGSNGNVVLSDYVKKEELPTKVSELENDSNYINKIKTINGQSLVGTGNIVIAGGGDGSGDGLPEVSVGVDTPGMGESLWLKTRENLFNKDTITPDVYINEAGELATHTTWNVSDFIPVEPGVNYTYRNAMHYGSSAYVGFYNADKELVSTVHQVLGANTITIADGVAYVRLSLSDLDISNLIFEQCSSDEIFNDTVCVKRSDGTYQEFLQENNPEIMTVQLSADTSMSIGSAWTRYTIPFNKIITQIGSNLTLTPEGKIKIGKGIRAISINCTMLYGSSLSMIETASRYKRGTTTKNINAAYDKGSGASTYYTLANVYPAFPVTEGDEIDFAITAASSGYVSVQKEGTFLCVQKIV